ncbi:hypothetical protein ACHAW6_000034 [Cyclotella cf. meneghiniana]
MGHLDQKDKGIRSTKSSTNISTPDPMAAPPQETLNDKTNMVFMTMAVIEGQLFTDQTGLFPSMLITSNHTQSSQDTEQNSLCTTTYTRTYTFVDHPQLHKLDNESSHNFETFITKNNAIFQYTAPDINQTNIVKHAICTWKNNFVAMHAGTAKSVCLSNWAKT